MTNSLKAQASSELHCVPVLNSIGSHNQSQIDTNADHPLTNGSNMAAIGSSSVNGSEYSAAETEQMQTNHHQVNSVSNHYTGSDARASNAVANHHMSEHDGSDQMTSVKKTSVDSKTTEAHLIALKHVEETIEQVIRDSVRFADNVEQSSISEQKCQDTATHAPQLNREKKGKKKNKVKDTSSEAKRPQVKKKKNKKSQVKPKLVNDVPNKKVKKSNQSESDKKRATMGPFVSIERRDNPFAPGKIIQLKINNQPQRSDEKEVNRPRVKSDLAKSALSSRYQPDTSAHDGKQLWLCSFCHQPSHHRSMGDLFGPYMYTPAENGVNMADENAMDTTCSTELWMHEDCIVWSNGTHFDGTRIRNIEQAYQDCCEVKCSKCDSKGASLRCLQKGCTAFYHYLCAKDDNADMLKEHFSIFCYKHKKRTDSANM